MARSNRGKIAVASVIVQLCLGAVHGWSVFERPLIALTHWTISETALAYTMTWAFFGVGCVIGGLWLDRVGPRIVTTTAALLYGGGYIVAGLAVSHDSLLGLYLGYGVLGGLGMGAGFICPLATVVQWFPERRGLMGGIAVLGFGAGASVMSPIAARIIIAYGPAAAFTALGVTYLLLIAAGAHCLVYPPAGSVPIDGERNEAVARASADDHYRPVEAIYTWRFWALWLMLFCNVSAGIMVMSQASPMAQEMVGLSPLAAAGTVGFLSIFNAIGRVAWAWISDAIGRRDVFLILYAAQAATFVALPWIRGALLFSLALALIGFCYGGGFGTIPAFVADLFGPKRAGGILGWILMATGAAAIPSPILIASIRQTTGHFEPALSLMAAFMTVALALPLSLRAGSHRWHQHVAGAPLRAAVVPVGGQGGQEVP